MNSFTRSTHLVLKLLGQVCKFWKNLGPVFEANIYQNSSTETGYDENFDDLRINLYAVKDWNRRLRVALEFLEKLLHVKNDYIKAPMLTERGYANLAKYKMEEEHWKKKSLLLKAISTSRVGECGIDQNCNYCNAKKAMADAVDSTINPSQEKKRKREQTELIGLFCFLIYFLLK